MHIISYKCLREFGQQHADCREELDSWFRVARQADWSNLIDVQSVFPKAESVGSFTVFNIKGNRYRLIASIDYEKQLIFIKYVLSQYQPKCIRTEAENERALEIVQSLMNRSDRTPEENELYVIC